MRIQLIPTAAVALVVVAAPVVAIAATSAGSSPTAAVRASASSVTATWDPGLNRSQARHQVTHGGRAAATRLLRDVDAAPMSPFDKGAWSCPADLGSSVTLTFRAEPAAAPVTVAFTGCATVEQAGHPGRTITSAIDRDLRALAPAAFLRYLHQ